MALILNFSRYIHKSADASVICLCAENRFILPCFAAVAYKEPQQLENKRQVFAVSRAFFFLIGSECGRVKICVMLCLLRHTD
jgi:hypothetical protein